MPDRKRKEKKKKSLPQPLLPGEQNGKNTYIERTFLKSTTRVDLLFRKKRMDHFLSREYLEQLVHIPVPYVHLQNGHLISVVEEERKKILFTLFARTKDFLIILDNLQFSFSPLSVFETVISGLLPLLRKGRWEREEREPSSSKG